MARHGLHDRVSYAPWFVFQSSSRTVPSRWVGWAGSSKGATSGFVDENRPLGFGYHSHTCMVTRSGCQKTKGDPVSGLFGAHPASVAEVTNVPSSKWQAAA